MPLVQCPFCVSTNLKVHQGLNAPNSSKGKYFVVCEECGAQGPHAPNEEDAGSKWNTRAKPNAQKFQPLL